MKTQEKAINFIKATRKTSRRKWHLRRVWKGMEKDDLGSTRTLKMNELGGFIQHGMECQGRRRQRALSAHVMVCLPLSSLLTGLSSSWSAQQEKLNRSYSSFLSCVRAHFHLPMSINLMGCKCSVFQWTSSIHIVIWFFRILFSRSSYGFILSTLRWSLSFYLFRKASYGPLDRQCLWNFTHLRALEYCLGISYYEQWRKILFCLIYEKND